MDLSITAIVAATTVGVFFGIWWGWSSCNQRWIEAADKSEPVDVGDAGRYFVYAERWTLPSDKDI